MTSPAVRGPSADGSRLEVHLHRRLPVAEVGPRPTAEENLTDTGTASSCCTCRCRHRREDGASAPGGRGRHGDAGSHRTTRSRATSAAADSAPRSECCSRAVRLPQEGK